MDAQVKKILIIPPKGWPDADRETWTKRIDDAGMRAVVAESADTQVLGYHRMLVINGGSDPNFELLRKMGEAARKAGVEITYGGNVEQDFLRVTGLTAL
ncbi:hypothetical protein HYW59_04715 [Candidatus Kaiserbacteria bacterium]|nr:hypothetical protein [Candidatus Kaiserbacteria bacterium]